VIADRDRQRLELLPGEYAVCRLGPGEALPEAAQRPADPDGLLATVRTGEELSLLCPAALVPSAAEVSGGWRALRVAGPLAHEQVGVLASLAQPLAAAEVPIFAVSTHLTDYLLVPGRRLERALRALRSAGHVVVGGESGQRDR
jgi:uncharacterized protein